jgi:SAM-dependent methyltransferase
MASRARDEPRPRYDRAFYERQQGGSLESARHIVPVVLELLPVRSVVDVGCGVGTWLSVFETLGVRDLLGIDGEHVDRAMLRIDPSRFRTMDLANPQPLERGFDVAVCLEVAEHLPAESAEPLIGFLSSLAPAVLFSAAIPHQGGVGHVNERWPEYWAAQFRSTGYLPIDAIRPRVWRNRDVQWWYAQNTLLYARPSLIAQHAALRRARAVTEPARLAMVHPRRFAPRRAGLGGRFPISGRGARAAVAGETGVDRPEGAKSGWTARRGCAL